MKLLKGDIVHAPALGALETIPDGALLLDDDGTICEVLHEQPQDFDGEVFDCTGKFIMQSFADMHLHAPQFPNVGTGMDLPLLDWLKAYTFPVEAKFADLSYARRVYRRLARDLIANGTTRVCMFSSLHTDATLVLMEELERAGVTGFVGSANKPIPLTEDEVAALGADAVADKGMTVFPRNENGEPVLYDYQIKGFFKDSCGMLARVGGKTETGKKRAVNESGKLSAYKKVIDGLIFPQPRMIPIKVNGKIGDCQRPLRAQTAQGERVSLANSEEIPAGSTCEFEILLMDESLENAVLEWLDYGVLRGIGQWRNSGKGRFTFDIID